MDFSEVFSGLATIITACVAIFLVILDRRQRKSDAAKLILQEIRRAEAIMANYIEHREYKFTKKIIATNSWTQNIHHFVNDLDQDEIDKISTVYSTGHYLDLVIADIAKTKLENLIDSFYRAKKMPLSTEKLEEITKTQVEKIASKTTETPVKVIRASIEGPWNDLFDDVISKYEFIYHSDICRKLKEIAHRG